MENPDAVFMEFARFSGDDSFKNAENAADLVRGAVPVLRGKSVEGYKRNSLVFKVPDDRTDIFNANTVPFKTRQAALFRPATVAVEDNGYMAGEIGGIFHIFTARTLEVRIDEG